MIGSKLKSQLNKKFRELERSQYSVYEVDENKDYDLNKGKIKVKDIDKNTTIETKVHYLKYRKNLKWLDEMFNKVEFDKEEKDDNNKTEIKIKESPKIENEKNDLLTSTSKLKNKIKEVKTSPEFIRNTFYQTLSDKKYGKNKYILDNFNPGNVNKANEIYCNLHGKFRRSPKEFFNHGKECPKCMNKEKIVKDIVELNMSSKRDDLFKELVDINSGMKIEDRLTVLTTKELFDDDFVCQIFESWAKELYGREYDMSKFKPEYMVHPQIIIYEGKEYKTTLDSFFKKRIDIIQEEEKPEEKVKEKQVKKKYNAEEENKKLLADVLNQPEIKISKEPEKIGRKSSQAERFERNISPLPEPKKVEKKEEDKYDIQYLINTSDMNLNFKIHEINKRKYSDAERLRFYNGTTILKHGRNKYIMDKFKPNTIKDEQEIVCKVHGTFKMTPGDFLIDGKQCPKCSQGKTSMTENFVKEYIRDMGIEVNTYEDRDIIKPYGIDIIIEDLKLAIEVNGIKYHSSETRSDSSNKYHQLRKLKMLADKGYSLISIYDDEIPNDNKNIGWDKFSKFLNEIMLFNEDFVIDDFNARSMQIRGISYYKFREFFENSRQQFDSVDFEYKGVFYKEKLVSVFSYNKETLECHNYHTVMNNKYDLELIGRTYKDLKFIVKRDSYVSYKLKDYGMISVAETEPEFCNFTKTKDFKTSYFRTKNKDVNNKNKIYDCGKVVYIF